MSSSLPAASILRPFDVPTPNELCDAMNEALARAGSVARFLSIDIERVRRKPEKIVIGGTADVAGGGGQLFGVRLFGADVAAERYQAALSVNPAPSWCGPGVLFLPSLGAVAWLFPNDRKISRLPDLIDRCLFESRLLPLILDAIGCTAALADFAIDVLRYVPEQSCTVELTLFFHDGTAHRLIGKCASDLRGAIGFEALRAIAEHAAPGEPTFTAKPISYSDAQRLLWQEKLPGAAAKAADFLHDDDPTGAAAMTTLARIHACGSRELPRRSFIDCGRQLKHAAFLLPADLTPGRARRAVRLVADQVVACSTPAALLHGDLHMGNFLIDREAVHLIDFDAACSGPPELDVGSLFAALAAAAILDGRKDDFIAARLCQLTAAYERHAACPLDRIALDWAFRAALLTERFYRSRSRMKPGRVIGGERLIEWAEAPRLTVHLRSSAS